MARVFLTGFEIGWPAAGGDTTSPDVQTVIGTTAPTRDTATKRSGASSCKCTNASPPSNSGIGIAPGLATAAGRSFFIRFYVNFTNLPDTLTSILALYSGPTTYWAVKLTTGGKLQLWDNPAGAQRGSDSTETIGTGTWHKVELKITVNATPAWSTAELRLNGTTVATGTLATAAAVTFSMRLGWLDNQSSIRTLYLDDLAVNDDTGSANNSWCGTGKVLLNYAAGDLQVGSWTGGAGGTTNLYDAVNNTPPIGTASETNLTQIESADSSGDNTTDEYRCALIGYGNAGMTAGEQIVAIQTLCCHGEDALTGTKTGSVYNGSNPVESAQTFTFGADVGALGTWPTNWRWQKNTPLNNPTITGKDDATWIVLRKTDATTNVASVCFLGVYFEVQASSAVTYQETVTFRMEPSSSGGDAATLSRTLGFLADTKFADADATTKVEGVVFKAGTRHSDAEQLTKVKASTFLAGTRHSVAEQLTRVKSATFKMAAKLSAASFKQGAAQIKAVTFRLAAKLSAADAATLARAATFRLGTRHSDADQATFTEGATFRHAKKLSTADAVTLSRTATFRLATKASAARVYTKVKTAAFKLGTRIGMAYSKAGSKAASFRMGAKLSAARNFVLNRSTTFKAGTKFSSADAVTKVKGATFRLNAKFSAADSATKVKATTLLSGTRFSDADAITHSHTVTFRHTKKLSAASVYVPAVVHTKTTTFRVGAKFSGSKVYIPAAVYTKAATFRTGPKLSAVGGKITVALKAVSFRLAPKLSGARNSSMSRSFGRPLLILKGRPCTARGCPPSHTPIVNRFIVGDGTVVDQWLLNICQVPQLILRAKPFGIQNTGATDVSLSFSRPMLILRGRTVGLSTSTSLAVGRPKLILKAKALVASPSFKVVLGTPLLILKAKPVNRGLSSQPAFGRPKLILLARALLRAGAPGLVPTECEDVTLTGSALDVLTLTPEACVPATLSPTVEEDETLAPTTEEDELLTPTVTREL